MPPPHLTLFEPFGLGAGGTGAAAGLIHPFAPTGKPMWRGAEAFREAEALVAVAEAHRERQEERERRGGEGQGGEGEGEGGGGLSSLQSRPSLSEPLSVSSRSRMLRPAEDARQARDFARRGTQRSSECSATPVSGAEARRVLPGVSLPFDDDEESGGDENSVAAAAAAAEASAAAALVVEGGLVIDPKAYLRHLWAATVEAAEAAGGRAELDCDSPPVRSLAELDRMEGIEGGQESRRRRFDVVVVAAGAAVGAVAEVGEGAGGAGGVGSCELVQGWTATVAPPSSPSSSPPSFPEAALLGKTYAAPRRKGGCAKENGGERDSVVAVGATRSAVPVSAEEALAHCAARGLGLGPEGAASVEAAAAGGEEASRELLERFARLWPQAGGGEQARRWRVVSAASGVRARPRRSGAGRPPLAGKLESSSNADGEGESGGGGGGGGGGGNWWVIGGLGSRGLLYSAWLGREVARAALADAVVASFGGGDGRTGGRGGGCGDSSLDPELTRWKRWKKM